MDINGLLMASVKWMGLVSNDRLRGRLECSLLTVGGLEFQKIKFACIMTPMT